MDERIILDDEQNSTLDTDDLQSDTADYVDDIEISPYALNGGVSGTISATYLDYFEGVLDKIGLEEHYVIFRSGDYRYTLAYGKNLMLNGSTFSGTGLNVVNIYRDDNRSDWYTEFTTDSVNLNASRLFVYSDLGKYPGLEKGVKPNESLTALFFLAFFVVYFVCHDIYDYVMERIYRR